LFRTIKQFDVIERYYELFVSFIFNEYDGTMRRDSMLKELTQKAAGRIVPETEEEWLGMRLGVRTMAAGLFLLLAVGSASAQENVCTTAIGTFTSDLITAIFGVSLALVVIGLLVSFGGRGVAFSGRMMGTLSSMSSNSLIGLIGVVFTVVIVTWVLGYAPIDIPQGCVPFGG
jgi:hypothetical protein